MISRHDEQGVKLLPLFNPFQIFFSSAPDLTAQHHCYQTCFGVTSTAGHCAFLPQAGSQTQKIPIKRFYQEHRTTTDIEVVRIWSENNYHPPAYGCCSIVFLRYNHNLKNGVVA